MTDRKGLLCPAPPPAELRGFPFEWLSSKRELWRVTRTGRGPWWFGSSGVYRFDIDSPMGTCYVAGDMLGALREVIGARIKTVEPSFVEERHFVEVRVEKSVKSADTKSNKAVPYGVTNELSTSPSPYDCPQSWARAFAALGYRGVSYWLRFSPSPSIGYAIFDQEGAHDYPIKRSVPISEAILNRLYIDDEVQIVRIPRSNEIVIVEP